MHKPVIAISPLFNPETGFYQMRETYTQAIERAGGVPMILPLTTDPQILDTFLDLADGFLFAGGHDLQPSLYSGQAIAACGLCCARRDEMELYLIGEIYRRDLPAFGICRGMQLINIALGGDLFQDIQSQRMHSLTHSPYPANQLMSTQDNRHRVWLSTRLARLFETEQLEVNSFHHQAIHRKAENLDVLARAEDGIIEAVQVRDASWIMAVQWHPELLCQSDPAQLYFFEELVRQAAVRHERDIKQKYMTVNGLNNSKLQSENIRH